MAIRNTLDQLTIEIVARSEPSIQSTFVVARMSTPGGQSSERVFDLKTLSDDARPVHKMAADLGIAVLHAASKSALLDKFEKAIAAAAADTKVPAFIPALQPGWHGDVFVTPQKVYGTREEQVKAVFTDVPPTLSYYSRGTSDDWLKTVGWMMKGNPLPIFLACAALMPLLLRLLECDQGCGFALIGKTRGGKTSLSTFLGSLYGGGDETSIRLLHSLRTSMNGLEPVAPFANDRAFFLDDAQNLPDDDKRKASVLRNAIYMLHQGRGKDRMGYESSLGWLTVFFICHNQTLQETMADGRQKHNRAAEMRLVELPCDREHVVFDNLHNETSASDFADALRRRSNRCNGAPFDAFMEELTRQIAKDREAIVGWLKDRVDSMRHSYLDLPDADYSVGKYFCLAYAAGRFAQEYCGILPVSADEIREAVVDVYRSHRRHIAKSAAEADPVIILRQYIDKNRDAFLDLRDGRRNSPQGEVLGYITEARERKEYSFTSEQFTRAVAPIATSRACVALKVVALLIHDSGSKESTQRNVTKREIEGGRSYVYCISDRIFDERPM